MALSVTYTNFCGQIVHENRSGTESFYAPDTLGSTAMLLSPTGSVTDTYTYWPYGEIKNHTGSSTTPFTFVGTLGYYLDMLGSLTYVRARHLRQALARWQTLDPLWPGQQGYVYSSNEPVFLTDASGKWVWVLASCLIGGAVGTLAGLLGGDSPGTALCKGAVDCAVAALVSLLLPEAAGIAGCLLGLGGSLASTIGERLCGSKPPVPCPSDDEPSLLCAVLFAVIGFGVGCIGAGEELQDALIGLVSSLAGADCEPAGKTSVPGVSFAR